MDLSTAILTLSENGDLQRIHDKWLSPGTCASQSTGGVGADRLNLGSFWGLFLICGVACFIALLIYFARILRQFCKYHGTGSTAGAAQEDDGGSGPFPDPERSVRRPARLTSIRDLMSFVDMKEAEVKRAIRSRSDRRLDGSSIGRRSYTSEGPSLSRPSSMSPV